MERKLEKFEEKESYLREMATSCHPKDKEGKYPMWIRVEYTNGEYNPPHAHLYSPDTKPSSKSLITKFLITENPPINTSDIQVMKGKPTIPTNYAKLIIEWAADEDDLGINNWLGLRRDWRGLEKTPLWEKRPRIKTIRNRNMSHTYTLISFGEKWRFKTAHCLDMNIRQIFEDLLSLRNRNHWNKADLERFLAAKGGLVSECIAYPQTGRNDTIPSVLTSEKFKNIKKLIVCVYSHSAMTAADYGKILEQVSAAVSAETEILTGWICDEKTNQNSVAINLIAVCSE